MKKAISILLCLMLVISMAAPVFADEAARKYTLTINNTTENHTYEAYQIFSGKLDVVPGTDPIVHVLTDIEWGSSVTDGPALLGAILEAAAAADNSSPLKKLIGSSDAASLAAAISANITSDSESLDALAEIFGQYLSASPVSSSSFVAATEEDSAHYTISNLPAGYYLIKDKDNSLVDNNGTPDDPTDDKPLYDSYTKFILRVLKDEKVSPKSAVPSVDKEISDQLADNYGEYADFDINDSVYYKLTGHLPSDLSAYKSYYFKFYDDMPTGIVFKQWEQVYLTDKDNNLIHTFMDASTGKTMPGGIVADGADGDQSVTLEIEDLLSLYPNVKATDKIVVKYQARVTRDAIMASPMTNEVYVEYSNNPNFSGEGEPDKGETPKDVAHAFTFGIDVDKYDADNKDKKLPGAEFILYYTATENEQVVTYYAKVITKAFLEANPGYEINDRVITEADRGIIYGWTTNKDDASTLTTNENGEILLRGLDAGQYFLKETKAPAGYNLMETDVQIDITPAYDKDGNMTSVEYKVDNVKQESNVVGVRNSSGSTLPMTGGMGTTLFYIFGSVMFIGAAILLVTKKRMNA